jgi:hypothetical protein
MLAMYSSEKDLVDFEVKVKYQWYAQDGTVYGLGTARYWYSFYYLKRPDITYIAIGKWRFFKTTE